MLQVIIKKLETTAEEQVKKDYTIENPEPSEGNPTTHFPARDLTQPKGKGYFFFKFAIATTKSIVAIKEHVNFAFFFGNYQYPKLKNDFTSISYSN